MLCGVVGWAGLWLGWGGVGLGYAREQYGLVVG